MEYVKRQAKQSLENLVADRKTISDQINNLKRQLRVESDAAARAQLEAKLRVQQQELERRLAQISDL